MSSRAPDQLLHPIGLPSEFPDSQLTLGLDLESFKSYRSSSLRGACWYTWGT
jgi:hypothetical protein